MTETQTTNTAGDCQLCRRSYRTFLGYRTSIVKAHQVLNSPERKVVQHTTSSDSLTQTLVGQFTDRPNGQVASHLPAQAELPSYTVTAPLWYMHVCLSVCTCRFIYVYKNTHPHKKCCFVFLYTHLRLYHILVVLYCRKCRS